MILKPAALFAAIVALTFAGSVFAADPVNIEIMAVDEEPGSMVLTVSAVDENGQPFPGLDPSSFNVWVNDQALIVKELHNETDRQPASVLLLVDVSSSMAGDPIQQAQVAINEFIDVLEPSDEVALMAFSSGVNLVQDFTSDRNALDAAVGNLALADGTALYDGVMQAASKMAGVDRSRKLIVLLSDGLENINQGARDASIQAAQDADVSFITVSLGASTDREYLQSLTSASGGSLIEAATPAELRAAYTSLAFAIRSQYTLVTEVPRSIDRTVAGTLKIHVIHRADNAYAERALDPLEGAVPPPFTMSLSGIQPGDKHNGMVEVIPTVEEGIEVAKIDYILDDEVIHTSDGVGNFSLDASQLANGSHVLKVVATDSQGREGEVQVPFLVPVLVAPSEGSSLPIVPILILLGLLAIALPLYKVGKKRWTVMNTPTYSRIDTWAVKRTPSVGSGGDEPEEPQKPAQPAAPVEGTIQGRIVVMDEAAVRSGTLDTIIEHEMKALPLTFGSGPDADIRVDDAGGLIAAEEARVWVQRGRMVYHKLTTLSAMATEGVTAGWQFLDDGDEMRIGPYRIIFQTHQEEKTDEASDPVPNRLPQEHGMALHRSFGLTEAGRITEPQDRGEEPGPFAISPNADEAVVPDEETEAPAEEESTAPTSDWDVWGQPDAAEPVTDSGSAQPVLKWDVTERQDSPVTSESAPEGLPAYESGSSGEAEPADSDDQQPAEWGPTLLEPRSADWLVEQSQPVDEGLGHVVQPDAWSGFVSGDDEESSAPSPDDEAEDEEDRAWGT